MMKLWMEHLLGASLAICVLVPVLCMARRALHARVDARLLYAAWLIVALRLLLPFSWAVSVPQAVGGEALPVNTGAALPALAAEAAGVGSTGAATWLPAALIWVWGAGVAVVGAGMLIRNLRHRNALAGLPAKLDTMDVHRTACDVAGVRPPRLLVSAAVASPCLMGVVHPTVILPEAALRDEQLPYALLHEACHARAHDTRWAALSSVLCALFWFHPLVWLAARIARADAELACDARVVAWLSAGERLRYAQALVGVAARHTAPGFGGVAFAGERLRDRVQRIVTVRPRGKAATVMAALLLPVLLLGSFVVAEEAQGISANVQQGTMLYLPTEGGLAEQALAGGDVRVLAVQYGWAWIQDGETEGYVRLSSLAFAPEAYRGQATVKNPGETDRLNLREEPSVEATVLSAHFNGQTVEITSYGSTWSAVTLEGVEGYMHSFFLCIDPDGLLPALPDPPEIPASA